VQQVLDLGPAAAEFVAHLAALLALGLGGGVLALLLAVLFRVHVELRGAEVAVLAGAVAAAGFRLLAAAGEGQKVVNHVVHVQKAGLVDADVDEGGLHARQDRADPALVDVGDDALLAGALGEKLNQLLVLEDGHAALVLLDVDDDLFLH